jgi:hypothetical protein
MISGKLSTEEHFLYYEVFYRAAGLIVHFFTMVVSVFGIPDLTIPHFTLETGFNTDFNTDEGHRNF